MKYLLPLITALLLLAACHAPVSTPNSGPINAWTVELDVSGGIAGLQRNLQLDHGGQLAVVDHRTDRRVSRILNEAEMAEVHALLQALPEATDTGTNSPRAMPGGRCADCIETRLSVVVDGVHHSHTAHSGVSGSSPYDALRQHLSALLRQALER